MDIFHELGIRPYVNAHDTYTIYGGSRMSEASLEAMRQISQSFVQFEELQKAVGAKIAELTRNEDAFVTNGAAGALMLATAVCLAGGDPCAYMRLPETGERNEAVLIHAQHNAYDKAIASAGAKVVMVGDADETLETELEGAINARTVAVFYFINCKYAPASPPLQTVIRIAHKHDVPVVVDAAAQLPPVENLWTITSMGADMVIFSGGKTLCGPQDSGLILGRAKYLRDCHRFGAPAHGVCRTAKTSREALAGLWIALRDYVTMDHEANARRLYGMVEDMKTEMKKNGLEASIVPFGPVGQSYPRLFIRVPKGRTAQDVAKRMLDRGIYIGCEPYNASVYISPLNLTPEEADAVRQALLACMAGDEPCGT